MKPWMLILTGLCAGLLAGALLFILIAPPRGNPVTLQPEPTRAPILVHLEGEIVHPGLYRLPAGSRLQDGVDQAGGLTNRADAGSLNLAERLEDGQKIVILPRVTPFPSAPAGRSDTIPLEQPAVGDGRINLNLATLDQLDTLPGIGDGKARMILEYRQKNGPFKTVEAVMDVPGIGQGIFDAIKEFIYISSDLP